jgi:hypothetical protein
VRTSAIIFVDDWLVTLTDLTVNSNFVGRPDAQPRASRVAPLIRTGPLGGKDYGTGVGRGAEKADLSSETASLVAMSGRI